jgi:hypothetical protein
MINTYKVLEGKPEVNQCKLKDNIQICFKDVFCSGKCTVARLYVHNNEPSVSIKHKKFSEYWAVKKYSDP